ncbi:hypothetical protein V2J09_017329 [Rumex salicifolius]
MATSSLAILAAASLLLVAAAAFAAQLPPVVSGLSWTYYQSSCPSVEKIVRNHLKKVFATDIGLAAGLLRVHFHDCFVQGCDGSVLLEGSGGEQTDPPNLTLRPEAIQMIDELRGVVQKKCGQVVSCADITAIAARDSVYLDGLTFATLNATLANLPSPRSNATTILASLKNKGFTPTDVVALSGAHTIGRGHCSSFSERLYPTQDPTLDKTFANNLKATCPTTTTANTTALDLRTPNKFDNKYYLDLMNRQGLFTSDEDLYINSVTKGIVKDFAVDQSLFFQKFVDAVVKMGQLSVLTGAQGEVRGNCSVRNGDGVWLSEVVGDLLDVQDQAM